MMVYFFLLCREINMAQNSDHHTQKITISKKTVKVTNSRDDVEFPKAVKKEGKYILPWETTEQPPDGMTNFRYFFTIDESKVPNEKVRLFLFLFCIMYLLVSIMLLYYVLLCERFRFRSHFTSKV